MSYTSILDSCKEVVIKIKERFPISDSFLRRKKKNKETIRPKGWVEIYSIDKDGNKKLHEKSNLIVYVGREWLASRIFNTINAEIEAQPTEYISYFGLGTGGCTPGDPMDPVAPTNNDTDLDSAIIINATDPLCKNAGRKHPISTLTFEMDTENDNMYLIAKCEIEIGTDDANDNQLNEAALYSAESPYNATNFHLFSRVTFSTMLKDETRSFLFVWYIYV